MGLDVCVDVPALLDLDVEEITAEKVGVGVSVTLPVELVLGVGL